MVINELYRYYIKVFDLNGNEKTDLIDGDFVKILVINGSIDTDSIVIAHVGSGVYKIEVLPIALGDYFIELKPPATCVPQYFLREEFCYANDVDDFATEANATLNKDEIIDSVNTISQGRDTTLGGS